GLPDQVCREVDPFARQLLAPGEFAEQRALRHRVEGAGGGRGWRRRRFRSKNVDANVFCRRFVGSRSAYPRAPGEKGGERYEMGLHDVAPVFRWRRRRRTKKKRARTLTTAQSAIAGSASCASGAEGPPRRDSATCSLVMRK